MGLTRRDFIRSSCCAAGAFGVATSLSRFGLMHALAQSAPAPYQALVCIFLFGGNDSNNLLVPMDTAGYANYLTLRGAQTNGGLALDQGSLVPVASRTAQNGSTSFGLHPNIPQLATLYTAGNLAFLANVGTLSQPVTRAQYLAPAAPVPANLFSHADQQQQWQTLEMDGFYKSGWAGRMADSIEPIFNTSSAFPPVTSVAGSAIFATGVTTKPYAMIPSPNTPPNLGLSGYGGSGAGLTALQALLTFDTGVSLIQAASSIMTNTLTDSKILSGALNPPPTLATVFPGTSLGNQLKQIAQIIAVRSALGLSRQVFFCSLGGFDTHSSQIAIQGPLLQQLNDAVNAFYSATVELNVAQQVTTFTMSDFSRTYQPGSNGGSDHAWGSVQMIVGGAVKGGDIYGTLPDFKLGNLSANDAGSNGRWIPTTSTDQYGATLAQWFGVSAANLAPIFPNLANFTTQKLGFI
jgi:uncharacterized protein (DUF1501 family)